MEENQSSVAKVPTSVNYHFSRQCNYKCGFCYFTALNSHVLPIDEAKKGLKMLKDSGMEKINFSGGEPFLHKRGKFLGELAKYCKEDLNVASVSIVSNGSLITEKWMQEFAKFVDILAISCDSFKDEINQKIGRHSRGKNHLEIMRKVHEWCKTYKIMFKINSVINAFNVDEDMNAGILELNPVRWKIFQCLKIEGENNGDEALRQVESFLITDDQFQGFINRHQHVPQLVPEYGEMMKRSYFILDEYMRFLDNGTGKMEATKSILDVGVDEAIKLSGFDEEKFLKRGGKYKWSKGDVSLDW